MEYKFSKIEAYTAPLIEELKQKIKIALETKDFGITWIEKNPGTQVRSSILTANKMLSPSTNACISDSLTSSLLTANKMLSLVSNLLTASINPIFEDPSEWYGDYYYPIWTPETAHLRPDIPYQSLIICLRKFFPCWPLDIIDVICFYLDYNHKAKRPLREIYVM